MKNTLFWIGLTLLAFQDLFKLKKMPTKRQQQFLQTGETSQAFIAGDMKDKEIVTIEKWFTDGGIYYMIIGSNDEPIDGFSKKWQAIDAIERWGFIRIDKRVRERK
jgi:hypothetical protein